MKNFKTIKIIHNIENRIEFLFFAEFFRLCGIFVGEYIYYAPGYAENIESRETEDEDSVREIEYARESQDECDAELYVGLDISEPMGIFSDGTVFLTRSWNLALGNEYSKHFSELEDDIQEEILRLILKELTSALEEKGIPLDLETFNTIGHIYVKHHLMKYLADMQYFRVYCDRHTKALGVFSNVESELREICNNTQKNNRYYNYARIYCASKANSAGIYNRIGIPYAVEELVNDCRKLINLETDFSNASVLLGLIYENLPAYSHEAIKAFEQALETVEPYRYAYHIYYWLGKRYEAYDSRLKYAEKMYLRANDHKERFRNFYKLGMINFKLNQYEESVEYFVKTLQQLTLKKQEQYLDPLEVNYYYKSSSMISYIYCFRREEPEKAIKYGIRAKELIENLDRNRYFKDFYKDEAAIYRSITKEQINEKKIYQYLSISYRRLGEIEEADKWRQRAGEGIAE